MKVVKLVFPAMFWVRRFIAAVVCLLVVACGGGGGPEAIVAMFSTMPAAVTLAVGETPVYSIGGGTAPYTANSSNLNFASATVSGKTLTILGKAAGAATVTVFDATGKSLGTVATVGSSAAAAPFFVTAPEAVTVSLSTATSYAISGGVGPYTASSSNAAVALASVNGTSLSIAGLVTGVAQVSIFDALGETKVVNVTVGSGNSAFALFTTVPGTVTLGVADKPVYTIGGGTAPYTASSTNVGLVKATVSGTSLTLEGVAAGTAQIQIFDATGTSRSATVTVGSGSPAVALFMTAPSAVTVAPSATANYTIGGGTGSYTASTSNAASASVIVVGSNLSVIGGVAGIAQVTVFDTSGASVSTVVTVSTGGTIAPLYITAPVAVTLAPSGTESYFIGGGSPPYRVSTANTSVATASVPAVPGNTLAVNGGASTGSTQVTIFDSAGNSVRTTVTIGTSASTTTLFVTAPSAVTVAVGPAVGVYTIGGGTAPYFASSNNNGVSTVTGPGTGTTLTINGVANGVAQINVLDSTGATVRVTVNVGIGGTGLYMTAPSTLSMGMIAPSNFVIGGGTAPYTVSTSNEAITTANVTGTALSIRGVAAGTAQVVVFDATGSSVSTTVTVGSSTSAALYVTAPTGGVAMTVGTTETLTLGGGTSPYVPVSSNSGVAVASLVGGNQVRIAAVRAGTALIAIFDANGNSISVAVNVVGASSASLFTTAPAAVTISTGGTRDYTVGGGSGTYNTPSSSNQAVASVSLVGSTLTVSGVTGGSATITVRDSLNATVTINVTVGSGAALFTSAPTAVTLAIGATPSYSLGGGAPITGVGTLPYVTSSSNAGVVTSVVSMVGTTPTLTLTGVAAGSGVVNVLDSTGSLVAINVTVGSGGGGGAALFTTAPGTITIANGAAPVYSVSGGTGPYTATSSNAAVATTTPTGALVGGVLTITSAGSGTANVVIVDAVGASVTIAVTVTPVITTPLVVTPSAVTANVGDVLNINVSGGSPFGVGTPYNVVVNNISVATASAAVVTTSGGAFTITLRNVGTTTVAITDSLGQTTTLTLTVNATATTLRLSPSALLVGEDEPRIIALTVYGGTGPYTAYTSDLVLSNASASGNVFSTGLGSRGSRCINPVDAALVYIVNGTFDVTLTVVDSLGASATSTLTIKDNGKGLAVNGCTPP